MYCEQLFSQHMHSNLSNETVNKQCTKEEYKSHLCWHCFAQSRSWWLWLLDAGQVSQVDGGHSLCRADPHALRKAVFEQWGTTVWQAQRERTIPDLAITSGLLFASTHKLKIFMPSSS